MVEAYEVTEIDHMLRRHAGDQNERDRLSDVISVNSVWSMLWRSKWFIFAALVLGLLLGIGYANFAGPRYVTTAMLVPADSDTDRSTGLAGVAGLFGGTDAPLSKFRQFQIAVFSSGVAELLDMKYGMFCEISPNCDPATGRWSPPAGFRASLSVMVRKILGMPPPTIGRPPITDFAAYISTEVTLEVQRSGALTLSMRTADPELSSRLLSRLIESTNEFLKAKDRESLRRYVAYLSDRLEHLTALAQRDSLQNLLLDQTRRLMLTEVGVPYAAATLDPPVASLERPYREVLAFMLVGALIGICVVLARAFLLPPKSREKLASL